MVSPAVAPRVRREGGSRSDPSGEPGIGRRSTGTVSSPTDNRAGTKASSGWIPQAGLRHAVAAMASAAQAGNVSGSTLRAGRILSLAHATGGKPPFAGLRLAVAAVASAAQAGRVCRLHATLPTSQGGFDYRGERARPRQRHVQKHKTRPPITPDA